MRVQTEEWRRIIPGVRMYKDKMTLFYNGEILCDTETGEYLIYSEEKRRKWQVIIVLPGVEVIPEKTFDCCYNVETVVMSETVRRIKGEAFNVCTRLVCVRLSTNLEIISGKAFRGCISLVSMFIPPSCGLIDNCAFDGCEKLIILSVPRHTHLGGWLLSNTALLKASPFDYIDFHFDDANEWIQNLHADNQFSLHRACASYNPSEEVIFDIVKRQGLQALKQPDSIGVTPSQYLSENPYTEIKEQKMINRYILDMMGEVI